MFTRALLISALALAASHPASPLKVLEESLPEGRDFAAQALQMQFKKSTGRPDSKLESGDIILYLEDPTEDQGAHPMPEAWAKGLQGIGHAALVAKNSKNKLYHLDSPYSDSCQSEFQGNRSYIVIRKKQKSAGFDKAVDKLAGKFAQIGYGYDTGFTTEALSWSADQTQGLRQQIEAWTPSSKRKPKIPEMYCSELPVTIYALLGEPMNTSIKMADVLDLGTKAQIISTCAKKGSGCEKLPLKNLSLAEISKRIPEKVSAQVAADISNKLIESFASEYREDKTFLQKEKKQLSKDRLDKRNTRQDREEIEQDLNELDRQLGSTQKLISDIEGNKPALQDLLRMRLGLSPCTSEKNPIASLSKKVYEALAYYSFTNRSLVRPVDLLKDTSQFEMVGYYAGDMPPTCDPDKE